MHWLACVLPVYNLLGPQCTRNEPALLRGVPPLAPSRPVQLLALLRSSAPYVRSEADWRTVCAIIKLTSGDCSWGRLFSGWPIT